MSEEGPLFQPYPYSIPSVQCPTSDILKRLSPWNIQEFFRVELLLRSQTLMRMYETWPPSPDNNILLLLNHGFTWDVLQGEHHRYLLPATPPKVPGLRMLSLQEVGAALTVHSALMGAQDEISRQANIKNFHERFITFWLDPSVPIEVLIKGIQPILEGLHQRIAASELPKQIRPKKFNVKTWLDYLHCYDLRTTENLPYGKIAWQVYKKKGVLVRDQAEKAVSRVQIFIQAVEKNQWPPPLLT